MISISINKEGELIQNEKEVVKVKKMKEHGISGEKLDVPKYVLKWSENIETNSGK